MTDAEVEAAAAKELADETPKFRLPAIGVDRGPALPTGPAAHFLGEIAWAALSGALAAGIEPQAFVLDPAYFPAVTALLGLPVERREGIGQERVEIRSAMGS